MIILFCNYFLLVINKIQLNKIELKNFIIIL